LTKRAEPLSAKLHAACHAKTESDFEPLIDELLRRARQGHLGAAKALMWIATLLPREGIRSRTRAALDQWFTDAVRQLIENPDLSLAGAICPERRKGGRPSTFADDIEATALLEDLQAVVVALVDKKRGADPTKKIDVIFREVFELAGVHIANVFGDRSLEVNEHTIRRWYYQARAGSQTIDSTNPTRFLE
jgi:hypothetical protein